MRSPAEDFVPSLTGSPLTLAQVGIPALVLERDSELRLEGSAINLWSNAFRALEALGIAQPLLDSHPALGR